MTMNPEQDELSVHGLDQWNGVAIASRVGLTDVVTEFPGQPGWTRKEGTTATVEARALGATVGGWGAADDGRAGATEAAGPVAPSSGAVRLWSLYVPNGRELTHPHYEYKLAWLEALRHCVIGGPAGPPRQALGVRHGLRPGDHRPAGHHRPARRAVRW